MCQIFKDKGLLFQEITLAMSLIDGQQTTGKGNRTLLGTDFLSSAGLVLDVKNTCWYFWENPTHKYPFGEELDTPSIAEKMISNTCQLREGEGESLTSVCVPRRRNLTSCWNPSKMSSNQGEKQQIS
ncbi:retrovirus-related Pol polyprotein from transposon opus [Trichonephila clavipes]|nr:retrovirus-related Pol polyprotein from transposon opus [Trichonephila clavipes]